MFRLLRLLGLFAMAAASLPGDAAAAVPIAVTSTANGGPGTLRAAIEAANSQAGPDSIQIEVGGTIALQNKLPLIEEDLAITGPGPASLTVWREGPAFFRVLEFASGVTGSLTGLTVSGGSSSAGGGILNGSGSLTLTRVAVVGNEAAVEEAVTSATADGGGIHSAGPLTLRESVVSGNRVTAGDGISETAAGGGGIFTFGKLTLDRSTISGNVVEAAGDSGKIHVVGGGVYALGEVKIERSTISGNSILAAGEGQTGATGGGISADSGELTGLTVTGNSASASEALGANLHLFGDPIVRNTLVSDPQGDAESCFGTFASGGFNLDEDGSCGFGKATDLVAVIAGLDPVLRPNGGPTPTHALLSTSVAIDRGSAFGGGIDQRGLPRPSDFATVGNAEGGDGSDIGAFELQVPLQTPVLVSANAADRQAPNTRIVSGPPRVTYKRLAKFRFASTEPQPTFQCKLDRRRWRGCANPFKRKVSAGAKHVFKVRAIDRFGNVDPTPARFGWRVKKIGG